MAFYKINGKEIFIDSWLKAQLDKKVIPSLKKKDKDHVFVVDGDERSGKSVFSMGLVAYVAHVLGKKFNNSNMCMTPIEFRKRIMEAKKNECIVLDEGHRGMGSSRALSEVNKILKDLMMEMGQKNLLVIIVLPTFFLLEKYAALFRAKGLFHIYERKGKRGYWVFFNKKNKLNLYMKGKRELNYNCMKWPRFRGRFCNDYPVDEKEYRLKKAKSFKEKPRLTKAEVYLHQRNQFIYVLSEKLGIGKINLDKLCKIYKINLKQSVLGDILALTREMYAKTDGDGNKL